MSKRLQVLIEPKEYKQFQKLAREAGLSLGEWVRQSMRTAAQGRPKKTVAEKLAAIEKAAQLNAEPAVEIDQMLAEIEQGYLDNGFR